MKYLIVYVHVYCQCRHYAHPKYAYLHSRSYCPLQNGQQNIGHIKAQVVYVYMCCVL